MQLLNENPRLGLESKNPALHPGHNLSNFTAEIGDSWSVASETRWSHEMGRFLSPDSMPGRLEDPQSWNLYSYVLNNPLTNTDPDGHDVQVCDNNGQCNTITNAQYQAAQQASSQGGLSAPTLDQVGNSKDANGNFTSVGITNSSGQQVGTATYTPGDNPGIDPYVGNNMAGLQTLGAANKAVTYAAVGTAVAFGGVAAAETVPGAAAAVGRWGLQRLAFGASSPALLNLINRLYQAQDEISGGTVRIPADLDHHSCLKPITIPA